MKNGEREIETIVAGFTALLDDVEKRQERLQIEIQAAQRIIAEDQAKLRELCDALGAALTRIFPPDQLADRLERRRLARERLRVVVEAPDEAIELPG